VIPGDPLSGAVGEERRSRLTPLGEKEEVPRSLVTPSLRPARSIVGDLTAWLLGGTATLAQVGRRWCLGEYGMAAG
jgi:hypothetical protein